MKISLIAALDRNGVIGKGSELPWKLSTDMRMFKERTTGKAVLMGRKTFDSVGKPLPNRLNIVVTRDTAFQFPGVEVAHTLEEGLRIARDRDYSTLFVIGGGEIYLLALPHAMEMVLTFVEAEVEGDVFFPEIDWTLWQEVHEESHEAGEKDEHPFTLRVYERKTPLNASP
jgi:dihydrofolate reductase